MSAQADPTHIVNLLKTVKDPEVPVVDVVELGIVRDVRVEDGAVRVQITPTYSGCPAMKVIEREIASVLQDNGFVDARVETVISPPWTSDWITDEAREKLRKYGIAPPGKLNAAAQDPLQDYSPKLDCPYCESGQVERTSEFGSTACKALYYCNSCMQPFEHFKCI